MSKQSKSIVGAAWAVLVMVALTFGATQAMAAPIRGCGGVPWQPGTCPPFTSETCEFACQDLDFFTGDCSHGCCRCTI